MNHWMVGYLTAGLCVIASILLLGLSFHLNNAEWLRNGAFGSYIAALACAIACFVMATRT